jgi:hypothetical protein
MAGRHRRPPAWRRFLLRLRRSDRAARFAALQAEVAALRATVTSLRDELGATRAAAAMAAQEHAMALTAALTDTTEAGRLTWLSLELPLVELSPEQVAADAAAAINTDDEGLDLEDTGEILLPELETEIVLPEVAARLELPEAALLDPARERDAEHEEPADLDLAEEQPVRRSA